MQQLLEHEASGSAAYDSSPPRLINLSWVELSHDQRTQTELRYVDLADLMINARKWSKLADGDLMVGDGPVAAVNRYPTWFNFASGLAVVLLVFSPLLIFWNVRLAVITTAIAIAAISVLGNTGARMRARRR